MTINIRVEQPEDYVISETIAREAFWNLYFPGCEEHYLLNKMRSHKDFIKELAHVIEVDGQIVGGIYFTNSKILCDDGKEIATVTFGPVFIHPAHHRQGLGKALINYCIQILKSQGYRALVILGYPYHYEPYGFRGGKKYGIAMGDGNYYQGLQALPLYDGALDGIRGQAVFSDVFEVDPEEVVFFDQDFPYKEKKVTLSQGEFAKASVALDKS